MDAPGEPLVLVPGLNNSTRLWNGLIAALPRSIAPHPVECPALDDVDAVAAALLSRLPPWFWLCGFSFGGYVALAMLARAPERVKGLALVATTARADSERQKEARRASIARAAAGEYEALTASQARFVFHPDNLDRSDLQDLRRAMAREYGAERFMAHLAACIARPDRSDLVAASHIPVLVAAGEADQVVPTERQRQMAESIPGACFVAVSGAGHMLPVERPADLAHALAAWMAMPAAAGVPAEAGR
ncbi:MAG TPA: alpha/beta hydrolase [Hyphomicrobiales bacterium]|nr:alpha/beta hydrolase [Hyphomicrobiales bacterium]